MMPSTVHTLLELPASHRWLLFEAFVLIVTLRAGLRALPFATMQRCLHRWGKLRSHDGGEPGDTAWAVAAVGRRLGGTTCLVEALAADCMLRRRGHAPSLKIGVRRGALMSIDAHAWVECSGGVVIGTTSELTEYAVLSSEQPPTSSTSRRP